MTTISFRGDYVTLAQALKMAGLAGSGGQAKQLARAGSVTVNGTVEIRPGRKLLAGDRFGITGKTEWTVHGEKE